MPIQVKDATGAVQTVDQLGDYKGQKSSSASLSVTPAAESNVSSETTQVSVRELLDTMLLVLEQMRNLMPMPDTYDRARVVIESGSVGIASNQTLGTLANCSSFSGVLTSGVGNMGFNTPALQLITNGITVTP